MSKTTWTIGHILILSGIYLLFYAGGLSTQASYYRWAARGDVACNVSTGQGTPKHAPLESTPLPNTPMPSTPTRFILPNIGSGHPSNTIVHPRTPSSSPQTTWTSHIERLVIPAIGLDSKVTPVGWHTEEQDGVQKTVWEVAEYMVGHHKRSANPGEGSNIVLAGHVGGYGMVFRDLYYLHIGDTMMIESDAISYQYVVEEKLILEETQATKTEQANNAKLIAPTTTEVVTLVSCWPPTGNNKFQQRVVVRAIPATPYPNNTTTHDTTQQWTLR